MARLFICNIKNKVPYPIRMSTLECQKSVSSTRILSSVS